MEKIHHKKHFKKNLSLAFPRDKKTIFPVKGQKGWTVWSHGASFQFCSSACPCTMEQQILLSLVPGHALNVPSTAWISNRAKNQTHQADKRWGHSRASFPRRGLESHKTWNAGWVHTLWMSPGGARMCRELLWVSPSSAASPHPHWNPFPLPKKCFHSWDLRLCVNAGISPQYPPLKLNPASKVTPNIPHQHSWMLPGPWRNWNFHHGPEPAASFFICEAFLWKKKFTLSKHSGLKTFMFSGKFLPQHKVFPPTFIPWTNLFNKCFLNWNILILIKWNDF